MQDRGSVDNKWSDRMTTSRHMLAPCLQISISHTCSPTIRIKYLTYFLQFLCCTWTVILTLTLDSVDRSCFTLTLNWPLVDLGWPDLLVSHYWTKYWLPVTSKIMPDTSHTIWQPNILELGGPSLQNIQKFLKSQI